MVCEDSYGLVDAVFEAKQCGVPVLWYDELGYSGVTGDVVIVDGGGLEDVEGVAEAGVIELVLDPAFDRDPDGDVMAVVFWMGVRAEEERLLVLLAAAKTVILTLTATVGTPPPRPPCTSTCVVTKTVFRADC